MAYPQVTHVDSTGKRTLIRIHGLNNMAKLTTGLYQSGVPDTEWGPTTAEIEAAGINVVVNLAGRGPVLMPPGMLFMLWRIDDKPELPNASDLRITAGYLADLIRSGKRVLIHCESGLNRASLLSGFVLVALEGISGNAAVDRIRERRSPDALCNSTFCGYLQAVGVT